MSKKILFITWDGPQTSYMEGLFMPIFNEISKREDMEFHVLQFTWGNSARTEITRNVADKLGIKYTALPILRKPIATLASFFTLFTSSKKIKKYIEEHKIDIVMPRSNFPALMVNKIKTKKFKLLFDADGLPIEERIDFSGLKRDSLLYKFLKSIETKMLKNADAVITRSQKAIEIHLQNIGEQYRPKFSVVFNGRNPFAFLPDLQTKAEMRKQLGIQENEKLFVYCGSLGGKYGWQEMLKIYEEYQKNHLAKFLVLTGNTEFANLHLPNHLKTKIIIKTVESTEVPKYLNAADIAFAIIYPTYSMQGVVPTKLGEYLLCGIPVIASKGIGDTEDILKDFEECYLFDHSQTISSQIPEIINFIENAIFADKNKIRRKAVQYFSLEAAACSYLKAIEKIK